MRQITLDTETTGLYPDKGDRIIEIGAVEIQNRRVTQNTWHCYLNPEREISADSERIHGLTTERLKNEPLFAQVADSFLEFIDKSELIIHNAAFDISFLNMELSKINKPPIEDIAAKITDTVQLAKNTLPGKSYSLDNLCDFYHISRTNRTLHGALIDSELLAQVYLALTRGQKSLNFSLSDTHQDESDNSEPYPLPKTKIIWANDSEIQMHEAIVNTIAQKAPNGALWQNL